MEKRYRIFFITLAVLMLSQAVWAQSSKKISATFKNTGGSGIYQLFFYADKTGKIYFVEDGQDYTGTFTWENHSGNFENGIVVLSVDGKSYSIDIESGKCTVDGVAMKRQ